MGSFSATTKDGAIVPADRMAIWAALTDADLLPRLTPLLQRIDTDGDVWTWHMMQISALGVSVAPSFTERMHFEPGATIEYHHEPPPGVAERAGAEGWYRLEDTARGTHLSISLTLTIELPLPQRLAPAVNRVMKATMDRTGARFSANLMRHLGLDERDWSYA